MLLVLRTVYHNGYIVGAEKDLSQRTLLATRRMFDKGYVVGKMSKVLCWKGCTANDTLHNRYCKVSVARTVSTRMCY